MAIKAGIRQLVLSSPTFTPDIRIDVETTCTYRAELETRESLQGTNSVAGYKESLEASFLEVAMHIRDHSIMRKLLDAGDTITAIAVLVDGTTVTLEDAWMMGGPERDLVNGTSTLRFESGTEGIVV